jgi:hypothetical protein
MNLVSRREFPVALPVASLGALAVPPPTIGSLRRQIKKRLDKLRSYDLFLRDRTVFEWWKDNAPAVRWMRGAESRARHDESHEFWTHLDEGQKRQQVAAWLKLVERGLTLAGDARQGGIGLGYGPNEPAPPKRAAAASNWLEHADAFVQSFEVLRQKMRTEARIHPSTTASYLSNALKPFAWAIGLGAVGVVTLLLLTRPRTPMRVL